MRMTDPWREMIPSWTVFESNLENRDRHIPYTLEKDVNLVRPERF